MKKTDFDSVGIFIAILATAVLILGLPLMWLWNWLVPQIFGLPRIGFLQAIGLNLMASILFRTNVNIKK